MSSNLEIWPEIEPIEDNIEHEDSIVAPFDTDEFFRSIVAVGSSGILKAKQKLGVTFNSD